MPLTFNYFYVILDNRKAVRYEYFLRYSLLDTSLDMGRDQSSTCRDRHRYLSGLRGKRNNKSFSPREIS